MRPSQIALVVTLLLLTIGAPNARSGNAAEVKGLSLPPRSRAASEGRVISSLGFKKTVVYLERYLRRRGLPHSQIPSAEARGVLLSRFLSESETSPWLAIHVYLIKGVTSIFVVARQADEATSEKPSSP